MTSSSPPAIRVGGHATKRRALYATRALGAGQTVHIFASPLVLLPTLAHRASVCTHCLRPGTPRACSCCRAAYYCDDACQRAGWAAVHARECKALRGRGGAALPTPVRALLQALLKTDVAEGLAGLEGNTEARRRGGGWADLEMMAAAACAFAGRHGAGDVARAVDLLCKIQTNAFHRFDADLADQVGIFIEPTLAMANHSCVPNAAVLFVDRMAVLRAERPIREGEEIEISYTDYTSPVSQRRRALEEYGFTCQCPRCVHNLNVYQVCAQSPHARDDNNTSTCVVGGGKAAQLRRHPGATDEHKMRVAAEQCAEVGAELSAELAGPSASGPAGRDMLRTSLARFRPLAENDLWAVSPLPQLLTEVSLWHTREQRHACALAVAAVVAVECDPHRHPAPWHVVRLKGLLVVAKLLVLTAEDSQSLRRASSEDGLETELLDVLVEMDQVSLCQMLLMMILRACPAGPGLGRWSLGLRARELLDDIARLRDRERELSLIDAWGRDPQGEASRLFFDYAVVQQMAVLAEMGKRLIRTDWVV